MDSIYMAYDRQAAPHFQGGNNGPHLSSVSLSLSILLSTERKEGQ